MKEWSIPVSWEVCGMYCPAPYVTEVTTPLFRLALLLILQMVQDSLSCLYTIAIIVKSISLAQRPWLNLKRTTEE